MLGPVRKRVGRWLLASVVSVGALVPSATAYAQPGQKRVLVLYSTRRDAQFSELGERELPEILEGGLSRNLDYYSEFIDLARSPEPGYRDAYRDFLSQKYQGVRFDLVIAMQDSAVAFV